MSVIQKPYQKEIPPDIKKMQQDAIKRVREMQKRAKMSLNQSNNFSNQKISDTPNQNTSENGQKNSSKQSLTHKHSNKSYQRNTNFLNNLPSLVEPLFKDKEKSIILILILILMGEKDDGNFEIILALFYILYS